MNTRRQFLLGLTATLGAARLLFAADPPPRLEEADPLAQALGFHRDTTRVDARKHPQHRPDQHCAACALYQGGPSDPEAPCTVFTGKLVPARGWCTAFARKP